ncbi:MAG: DUF192 domain-containing protein [Alphaproteobacteria bacterium]|nr:DUF192 domain-containing protein [Alphaproteobacteria bacterium]
MKFNFKKVLLGFFLIYTCSIISANASIPVFQKVYCAIKINKKYSKLFLEVADTFEKRKYGLMNREYIKPNSGMLFIWKDLEKRTFWMKNTYFDLDLFFLGKEGQVLEIYRNAKAFNENQISSKEKAMFVLELNAGKHQIKIGDQLDCAYLKL